MDKHIFKYGSYSYEYYLIKQKRKTISMIVQPTLKIVLKVPESYDEEKIEKFLKKKWKWLEKQITYFKKFNGKSNKKEYVSGESFLYLGRQYKLLVRKGKIDEVKLKFGQIMLTTSGLVGDKKRNKKILDEWYLKRSSLIFNSQYKKVFSKFNYDFEPNLVIRKMNKRWGSFLKDKKIFLNPLLIQAPKECIDYVITHELCHMKYKNHDKRFYKLLKSKIKNWEEIKEKLEMRFI
ncbi:MAG: M48 family metallopeptidase [Candidatus Pacebacteria bacterium]|nr:M48 family metallopeptidase [Candidatus Paceibacterota bacterium]